jgi:hypothetical protein
MVLVGVEAFPLVDPGRPALHLRRVLLRGRVQQRDLTFAAAAGGRADLLGVGLGLAVGVLEDRVGFLVGRLQDAAGLGAGGRRLGLRGGGLRAYRSGLGLGVVDLGLRVVDGPLLAVLGMVLVALQLAQRAGAEKQADHHQASENDDRQHQHPIQGGHLAASPFAAPHDCAPAVPGMPDQGE